MSEQKLREALQELVNIKDLKDRHTDGDGYWTDIAACTNYRERQPLAWKKAREALSQPTSDEGTPTDTPITALYHKHFDEVFGADSRTLELCARQYSELYVKARELERTLHARERELAMYKPDIEKILGDQRVGVIQSVSAAPRDAEQLARRFHDTYERLAPQFGYETRPDTKQFDPTTPNGRLMIAVCAELRALPSGYVQVPREATECSSYDHCPKQDDGTHCVHWWDGEACCSCGNKGTGGIVREWLQQVGDDGYRQDGERAAAWCLLKMLTPPTPSDTKPGEGQCQDQ